MAVTVGLLVTLEARPGKEDQVADDLLAAAPDSHPIDILAAKGA